MRTYDLFISHAWAYDERYEGIVRLLNSVPGFSWRDYSVPRGAHRRPEFARRRQAANGAAA